MAMRGIGLGLLFAVVFIGSNPAAFAQRISDIPHDVPKKPDPKMTPGHLCGEPTRTRYPERVPYCERDVDSMTKESVFAEYKRVYQLGRYTRHQFKIDHYIPLCMGGSNEPQNLWPQHLTISMLTDKSEALLCKGMSLGKLKQKPAIEAITRAKNDLGYAVQLEQQLVIQFGY
jgi:tetrahydromethanopterin S-methyltransferase subunit F